METSAITTTVRGIRWSPTASEWLIIYCSTMACTGRWKSTDPIKPIWTRWRNITATITFDSSDPSDRTTWMNTQNRLVRFPSLVGYVFFRIIFWHEEIIISSFCSVYFKAFLDASLHLYMRLCPSDGRSGPSVGIAFFKKPAICAVNDWKWSGMIGMKEYLCVAL